MRIEESPELFAGSFDEETNPREIEIRHAVSIRIISAEALFGLRGGNEEGGGEVRMVDEKGIEPSTSALRTPRSPN